MSMTFVLLMFIPTGHGASSFVAEFSDEMACYEAGNKMNKLTKKEYRIEAYFVCSPKYTKK